VTCPAQGTRAAEGLRGAGGASLYAAVALEVARGLAAFLEVKALRQTISARREEAMGYTSTERACLFLLDLVQPQAPVSLEHRQDPDVLTSDAIDDSIGPQEDLSDVVAPELRHDASAKRRRRSELCVPNDARCPAFSSLPVIPCNEAKDVDQVVA
jgi:hypothetical protein